MRYFVIALVAGALLVLFLARVWHLSSANPAGLAMLGSLVLVLVAFMNAGAALASALEGSRLFRSNSARRTASAAELLTGLAFWSGTLYSLNLIVNHPRQFPSLYFAIAIALTVTATGHAVAASLHGSRKADFHAFWRALGRVIAAPESPSPQGQEPANQD